MRSGNVNVGGRGLGGIFSGFCHIRANGLRSMGNFKLKLTCIGGVVRSRGKAVQTRDRLGMKAGFVVTLPLLGGS